MSDQAWQPLAAMPPIPMPAGGQKFLLAAARLNAHAVRAMMRYQIEALGFMKHRLEQDVKLVEDLAGSDEYNDAFDVFACFWQNAASEYAAEAGRVARIGSRLASEAAKEVRREARNSLEDMAVQTVA